MLLKCLIKQKLCKHKMNKMNGESGLASSEEERLLHKMVFSGDLSSNPASSKEIPRVFGVPILLKA